MALWAKLQELPEEAQHSVQMLYSDHFPIVVRAALAHWIEEKPWNDLDMDNPQHEHYAKSLVNSMIREIQAKANTENNFLMRLQLTDSAKNFEINYINNPFFLVNTVKKCLQKEMKIVQQAENHFAFDIKKDTDQEIAEELEFLRRRTQESEEDVRKMQQEQEQFLIQYQESQKRHTYIQQLTNSTQPNAELLSKLQKDKDALDSALRHRAASLVQMRNVWVDKHFDTFNSLNRLQMKVLDEELIRWKRGQQLAGNGAFFDNNLEKIQEWCECVADVTWQTRQQLERVLSLCTQLPFQTQHSPVDRIAILKKQINNLLSNLVTTTFILEKQPPQVMKTNTRFTSTVRLLVGGRLNVHMNPPQVKVSIISEAQANNILKADKVVMMNESSGEILNNTGTMEYHSATRQLSVNFRNMQLRKIKRAEKKGTESVMDEKFSLFFQSQFSIGGGELSFQVWTLSLPVVVIVHGNQEPHAWATVTWDNAFAESNRIPFAVPDKVTWQRVGDVLNMKFKAAVGRELTSDNLRFLAGKAFRNTQIQDYDNLCLTWGQFSKEPLSERNFTFWEWFYAILKVTKDHLRQLWNDGSIIGFIGRKQAEEMLLQRPKGTFLLRYSDSELGGITIAWHGENQERSEVFMLQPFTSRDFAIRGLPDRINDLKHLLYLYPDIPKDQAFGKYYTPITENQPQLNGYIKPVLVIQIPGLGNNCSFDSYPNTPQSVLHNPHSPGDASLYHENPASVRSNSTDHTMNIGSQILPDMDYGDIMNMDLASDMDVPVDFSTINVSDLMGVYDKQN
ncbi:signal transducer and activator of transcription 5B-like protein [Dinothrombium tinctorium]|uniref:Signal transducer and activator of transcription n=1 Tax=Dinothrombium tinctorium TaxID=1965070 RepID=A0A443QX96_9ACAR|nr:signal transducer and activator of transcription 5B-like protein [Dinothrombium tinctorium]